LAKSRFTLNEIGIIDERRRTYLKNYNSKSPWSPFIATIPTDKHTINMKRNLEIVFSSLSIFPYLVVGSLSFIMALVSLPVYITIARMYPLEARTVLAHMVFSNVRASLDM